MSDEPNTIPKGAAALIIGPEQTQLIYPKPDNDEDPVVPHVEFLTYVTMRMNEDEAWIREMMEWGRERIANANN